MFKLISATAFVFRCVNNLNRLRNNERNLIIKDEHLTAEELKNSFDIWFMVYGYIMDLWIYGYI